MMIIICNSVYVIENTHFVAWSSITSERLVCILSPIHGPIWFKFFQICLDLHATTSLACVGIGGFVTSIVMAVWNDGTVLPKSSSDIPIIFLGAMFSHSFRAPGTGWSPHRQFVSWLISAALPSGFVTSDCSVATSHSSLATCHLSLVTGHWPLATSH